MGTPYEIEDRDIDFWLEKVSVVLQYKGNVDICWKGE